MPAIIKHNANYHKTHKQVVPLASVKQPVCCFVAFGTII